jgi:hypothetical protein
MGRPPPLPVQRDLSKCLNEFRGSDANSDSEHDRGFNPCNKKQHILLRKLNQERWHKRESLYG